MVQVIPKEFVKKETTLKNILPWFSLLLVVIVIALYFIFVAKINRATVSFEEAKADLREVRTEERLKLERRILTYRRRASDFIWLLEKKQEPTKIFRFLEEFVHPDVYFSSLEMNLDKGRIALGGAADDFKSLGQQIFIFEGEPLVEEVELLGVSLDEEGKIRFNIELFLPAEEGEKQNLR